MRRKSYGLQTIDQKLTYLLRPIFHGSKKEFILLNNLVKNWPEIVGKRYAEFCYPKSASFAGWQKNLDTGWQKNLDTGLQKNSDVGGRQNSGGGKLTIAAYNSGVGFFLETNSELIVERIASFYGFKSISKIIIKQEPQNPNIHQVSEPKLTQQCENFLQEKVLQIDDKDLAATLQKLGREVFGRK